LLGVTRDASQEEISATYKQKARKLHPDKGGDPEHFKNFQKAFDTLKDPKKRQLYDRFGEKAEEKMGSGGGDVDAAEDIKVSVEITLAELYSGVKKEVEIEKTAICKKCDGVGAKEGADKISCPYCDGRGKVLMNYGFIQAVAACEQCEGKGKIIANEDDNCEDCNGEGTTVEKKTITLPLQKGMRYGGLKIPGEGNEQRDKISGSVIVVIRPPSKDPSGLKLLRNDDLFLLKDVSIIDALLGAKFSMTHLNGDVLAIQVPPQLIVSTGDLFKLKNKGMTCDSDGQFGDLFVQFNVIFPTEISEEQKEFLIKALGKPTSISTDISSENTHTLLIEKNAKDLQDEEDDSEHGEEEGQGAGGGCVQQ